MENQEEKQLFTEITIRIRFVLSPRGRKCIGMLINDQEYILLTFKKTVVAELNQKDLIRKYQAKVELGMPFDITESLKQNKLIPLDMLGTMGIYVEADKFDDILLDIKEF